MLKKFLGINNKYEDKFDSFINTNPLLKRVPRFDRTTINIDLGTEEEKEAVIAYLKNPTIVPYQQPGSEIIEYFVVDLIKLLKITSLKTLSLIRAYEGSHDELERIVLVGFDGDKPVQIEPTSEWQRNRWIGSNHKVEGFNFNSAILYSDLPDDVKKALPLKTLLETRRAYIQFDPRYKGELEG